MFKDKGVFCDDELIVNKAHSSTFLNASKYAGFAVIGIEGFYLLNDGSIKPNLDEIADFSDIEEENDFCEYIEACYECANRFLINMNSNGKSDGYCFILMNSQSHQFS